MKKNKIGLSLLTLLSCLSLLSVTSCGGNDDTGSTAKPNQTQKADEKCTVNFDTNGGSSVNFQEVVKGSSIEKPATPTKAEYIFDGWYLDSGLTQPVDGFPLTINSNTTLYAKWLTAKEAFLKQRQSLWDADSFDYDENLHITVTTSGNKTLAQGLREGNVKYSKTGDVNYLAKRVSSKGLLIDGTEHQIRKGTDFVTINQNEDGKVNKYEEKQVDASFKYDYSIYAKAVFEYGENDIKTVTGDGKRFELTTKESASNTVKSILGLINNPIIKMFVGQLPETIPDYHLYLDFKDGVFDKYTYQFSVSVSGQVLQFLYTIQMKSMNQPLTLKEPVIDGFSVNNEQINEKLNIIKGAQSAYKSLTNSAHDFRVETNVEYEGGNKFKSTIKGKAKRNIKNGVNFFNNHVEFDSTFADNYGKDDSNIKDFSYARGVTSDGKAHYVWKKLFGTNPVTEVTAKKSDYFFYLPDDSIYSKDYVSFIQTSTKSGVTTYSMPLNNKTVPTIFDMLNDSSVIDPTLSKDIKLMGSYQKDSIVLTETNMDYLIENEKFKSLVLNLSGSYNSRFDNYGDGKASFTLKLTIDVTKDGDNYSAPDKASKL